MMARGDDVWCILEDLGIDRNLPPWNFLMYLVMAFWLILAAVLDLYTWRIIAMNTHTSLLLQKRTLALMMILLLRGIDFFPSAHWGISFRVLQLL